MENEGINSKFNFECHYAVVNFDLDKVATKGGEEKPGSTVVADATQIMDGKAMGNTLETAFVQYPLKGSDKEKAEGEKGTEKTEKS